MIRTVATHVNVLRNGVRLTQLRFDADNAPSITVSADAAIKASLSGAFVPDTAVDWVTDRLQPVLVIDGAEHPCGVFVPATMTTVTDAYGPREQVEAYDMAYLLTLAKTETILHFDAGTGYIAAITQLLDAAGIVMTQVTASAAVMATAREDWDIGTSYLTIINQLLGEINYHDLWFDANGTAILEPDTPPSAATLDHVYDATTAASVTLPELSSTTDLFDRPNVFIVRCSNPDYDAPMIAVAENDNPQSDLSIFRRGIRIPQVVNVDNIADQAALQAYADRLRDQSMLATEETTIQTALMPGHGVYDVVGLRHPGAAGVYLEVGWTLPLTPGALMTHRLRRVIFA